MTTHYTVVVTCPRCGADVDHVAGGSRRTWQQAAAVKCTECHWKGVVSVELAEAPISNTGHEDRRLAATRREIDRERAREHDTALHRTTAILQLAGRAS